MIFGLSMLTRSITKRFARTDFTVAETLASASLLVFAALPAIILLGIGDQLTDSRRESFELLAPFVVMFLALLVPLLGQSVLRFHVKKPWLGRVSLASSILVLVASILYQPQEESDLLWHGFGWRVLSASVLVFAIWSTVSEVRIQGGLRQVLKLIVLLLVAVVYLPTFIQPPRGIINLGDASHQVMEEVSGPLVGHFPGINAVSTYTSLLGLPLLLLRPLPLSGVAEMLIVDVWINVLVFLLPIMLISVGIRSGVFRYWIFGAVFVAPILLVSGRLGSASSNMASLSMIPGRTLLPVCLGYVVTRFLPENKSRALFAIGAFGAIVGFNNIEFGVPAMIASFCCLLIFGLINRTLVRGVITYGLGLICAVICLFIGSLIVEGDYDIWFRIGVLAGKPYSIAGEFPIWSTHNLLLAVFATAITIGIVLLKRLPTPSICGIFFGLWGFLAFPYCSYRCVEGMYMSTQVYFIPAIGAAFGIVGCLKGFRIKILNSPRAKDPFLAVALGSLALGCIAQAPNPTDEWKRVIGIAESFPWASEPTRAVPSEWTPELIDFLKPKAIEAVREQITDGSVGYFGYMGNSVQLATGINNLTRINSGEVLYFKGSRRIEELACKEVVELQPRYIILTQIDLPCVGYIETSRYKTEASIRVLVRSDSHDG